MQNERQYIKRSLETLAIFIDYHNLEGSLRNEGLQIDLLSLQDYLAKGRKLIETFVYIGFNPNNLQEDKNFHRFLKINGFIVRTKTARVKPDGSLKCDLDIELTLDIVDYVTTVRPEILILITGDGDFVPLVNWLRMRGIRVEVGGIQSSMSQDLKESSNDYIDLQSAIEEIQGTDREIAVRREEVATNVNGNHQWQEGGDPVDDNR